MSDTLPCNHVLIFTKCPIAGFAKTRLIPAVGASRAAEISHQLTNRTITVARNFLECSKIPTSLRIHYATNIRQDANLTKEWFGQLHAECTICESWHEQKGGDLGQRLSAAFAASFEDGASKVLVIGSDIPEIDAELLAEAFCLLEGADLVIGPAVDGGYYLLGMKKLHAQLFKNIPWSTKIVCATTIDIANAMGFSVRKLRTLRDVDLPQDLPCFEGLMKNSKNSK